MAILPPGNLNSRIFVLSVAVAEDRAALSNVLIRANCPLCPGARWSLKGCRSPASKFRLLAGRRFPIVVCDEDSDPGNWIEMLQHLVRLPAPPCLIVTSRTADEHLWAQALNLGAYDVLAKPFDTGEVLRTLSLAWLHWATRWSQPAAGA